jgi:gluconolactonase
VAFVPREIATGVGRCEGPVIRADGEIVVTSMDQGRLYAIKDGRTRVLAEVGCFPNGAAEWSDGTIYVAQAGGEPNSFPLVWGPNAGPGGIQIVGRDGSLRWLTQDPISPNDLCFGPDGLLYVTDPTRYRPARDDGRLFRCNIETGEAELLCSLPWYPNGIGFGLEDDALYVAKAGPDYGIVRFPIDGGRLGKPELFADMREYNPDGFTFEAGGNLITTAKPGRIQTYDRNGRLVDTYVMPKESYNPLNVALSPDRMLIVTASYAGAVVAIDGWPASGLPLHPFRGSR